MARFIVQQPNGLYCVFGTVADYVLFWNLSKDELMTQFFKGVLHKTEKQIKKEMKNQCMSFDEVREYCRHYTGVELSRSREIFKDMGDKNFDE